LRTLQCLAALFVLSNVASRGSAFVASPTKYSVPLTTLSSSPSNDNDTEYLGSKARRALLASSAAAALTYTVIGPAPAQSMSLPPGYERVAPLQFIAALGDEKATSGKGAGDWGLWPVDPGPLGLRLSTYEKVKAGTVTAPAWLNDDDFFLDENAIVMPQPTFPLPPGKYLVTGARTVTAGLTIEASGAWSLDNDAKLYDVTHLPCRAARYKPASSGGGSPANVRRRDFPVAPGGIMPEVPGTSKQDYAVVFVVGKQK